VTSILWFDEESLLDEEGIIRIKLGLYVTCASEELKNAQSRKRQN